MAKKITASGIRACKQSGRRFTMITCYDFTMARIVNESKVDAILVGDSLGNIIYGYKSTIPVTLDQMILATQGVVNGAPDTFVVGDLPFGSYNASDEQAVISATRMMKEGGCDCVKLEGGLNMASRIAAIVKSGIPVFGHIGLLPQTAGDGMRVQGRKLEEAKGLYADIKAVEAAGAFAVVAECVPVEVLRRLNEAVQIPVFAGGKGSNSSGNGMNLYDMFGLFSDFTPRFAKKFGDYRQQMIAGLNRFHEEVLDGTYPAEENSYYAAIEGFDEFVDEMEQ